MVTVTGKDAEATDLTGTATFEAPAYAQLQRARFPKGFGAEVIPGTAGKKFKSITSVTAVVNASSVGANIKLYSMPSFDTFSEVVGKTQMNYDLKVPQPASVQMGRDMSKFVKPGEIPPGKAEFTSLVPSFADGLARINGQRVTGLVREIKEGKIETMRIFLLGMIATVKASTAESVDRATFSAEVFYEQIGILLAP